MYAIFLIHIYKGLPSLEYFFVLYEISLVEKLNTVLLSHLSGL